MTTQPEEWQESDLDRWLAALPAIDQAADTIRQHEEQALSRLRRRRAERWPKRLSRLAPRFLEPALAALLGGGFLLTALCRALLVLKLAGAP